VAENLNPVQVHLRIDGQAFEEVELEVHVDGGENALVLPVAQGSFSVPVDVAANATRFTITAKDGDPSERSAAIAVRTSDLGIDLASLVFWDISRGEWDRLFQDRRCISARASKILPWRPVIADLLAEQRFNRRLLGAMLGGVHQKVLNLPTPLRFPGLRTPICVGEVQVFRRTCCCTRRWYPAEPVIPPYLDDFVPGLGPDGPDPAPWQWQDAVLTNATIDHAKMSRSTDLDAALNGDVFPNEILPTNLVPNDLVPTARPRLYRWCYCGAGVPVATGHVRDGGVIHICWRETRRTPRFNCQDEYAFVIRQTIGTEIVTIYDGPAAGQWFARLDDIQLDSYAQNAVSCIDDDFPANPGTPFVILQDIGATPSYKLQTPMPISSSSVPAPAPDDGLLNVGPAYALGGDLHLRYHFSKSMRAQGATYFRIQVADAANDGTASSAWQTINVASWNTWRTTNTGATPGNRSLQVPDQTDMFHIPYQDEAPLAPNEEWQAGQFHAVVPTATRRNGWLLLRIQVFNNAGNLLDPTVAGFTYRRWNTETNTLPVTFNGLTHLLRIENRPVVADIVDITGPGAEGGDCKFFTASPGDQIAVQYRAYHPQPGTPSFMHSRYLEVRRGISGTVVKTDTSTIEVGETVPHAWSLPVTDLLGDETRCSFSVRLVVSAKVHNGFGQLAQLNNSDFAAFAVLST
jgi:hypothetical protein